MITTWQYRVKDAGSTSKVLSRMAKAVNVVWNFCKETQVTALQRQSARIIEDKKTGSPVAVPNFLSSMELDALVAGSSKDLGLHSQTIQAVTAEYVTRRKQFKKLLRWRGRKSLGWIPFKASGIQLKGERIIYRKQEFRYWNSRTLPADAKIKVGSFIQDARGRWYVSITFESESLGKEAALRVLPQSPEIGIDLGIKHLATLSNGEKIERPDLRRGLVSDVRKLERTRRFARKQQARTQRFGKLPKEKRLRTLQARAANARKDHLHKQSTQVVNHAASIVVGALPCRFMNRNRKLSGISLDSGIGMFRQMLRYKAVRAGVGFQEVNERNSTQTCSDCGWQHPQKSRIGLGVREWACPQCASRHDRDVNAARNILRMGRHTLIPSQAMA